LQEMDKILREFEGALNRKKDEFEKVLWIAEKSARDSYDKKMTQYISNSENSYVDEDYLDKKHEYLLTAVKSDCFDAIMHGPEDVVEASLNRLEKVTYLRDAKVAS
jgi:hypothetical protein